VELGFGGARFLDVQSYVGYVKKDGKKWLSFDIAQV